MVELLVVVGIITVMIAILLPALNRARESAKQIACLSNLRQVAIATVMYANENKGAFPGPSQRWPLLTFPWDWIYFRPEQGPLSQSAIAPYLFNGSDPSPAVLQCPSDDITNRPGTFNNEPYPFSYAFSAILAGYYNNGQFNGNATNYVPTMNLVQVFHPSEKVMFIEEDEASLNDGDWWPFGYDVLSTRHDRPRVGSDIFGNDVDRRGNVVFVDGHGEFVPRSLIQDPRHWDATLP